MESGHRIVSERQAGFRYCADIGHRRVFVPLPVVNWHMSQERTPTIPLWNAEKAKISGFILQHKYE